MVGHKKIFTELGGP